MPARRSLRIEPLGDAALLVELGQRVDTALNTRSLALAAALRRRRDVREAVPGYASVAVHYDPEQVTYRGLVGAIERLAEARPPPALSPAITRRDGSMPSSSACLLVQTSPA